MKFLIYILLIVSLFISSCVKDRPQDMINPTINLSTDNKIYIINEGPFNTGNGSVSLYDPLSNNVSEDFYFQQNSSYLGNIVQSMNKINNEYCICVNNSGKIVFCDRNFKKTHEILGLVSPRYIQQVSYQKAYVTDLYANSISVINLLNYSKTSSIPCYGKSEKMLQLYNEVYVTNTDKEYIFIINVINDNVIDSIYVGYNCYGHYPAVKVRFQAESYLKLIQLLIKLKIHLFFKIMNLQTIYVLIKQKTPSIISTLIYIE
jgi:hypothetical protein